MLKQLKSLFIITEEAKTETSEKKTEENTVNTEGEKTENLPKVNTYSKKVDNGILEKLLSNIEQNNLEGYDYFEFRAALINMAKLNLDEPTKFRSAFASLSPTGLTVDKLSETGSYYIDILVNEEKKFSEAIENQVAQKIEGNKSRIIELEKMISEKSEMIKKFTEEIQVFQTEIGSINQKLDENSVKIEQTKNSFTTTMEYLKNEIITDINKIKEYLK